MAAALAFVLAGSGATAALATRPGEGATEAILEGLDAVARVYRDHALRFTCDETIVHDVAGRPRVYRFRYVYRHDEAGLLDYRLSRAGGEVPAEKILTRRQLEKRTEAIDLDEGTELPTWVSRAYSWIFLFERARQPMFSYTTGDGGEISGRSTLRIDFEPRLPVVAGVNDWAGTAWVDAESLQLLRVEALRADENRERLAFESDLQEAPGWARDREAAHRFYRVVTDYGVERDGLRLPSEVLLQASRYVVRGGERRRQYVEYPDLTIRQSYDNYRVYGVRIEGEVGRYEE